MQACAKKSFALNFVFGLLRKEPLCKNTSLFAFQYRQKKTLCNTDSDSASSVGVDIE